MCEENKNEEVPVWKALAEEAKPFLEQARKVEQELNKVKFSLLV